MDFDESQRSLETYSVNLYLDFLNYIKTTYAGSYWNPLPEEMVRFYESKVDGG